jgi:ADP-ribose pyrophosphatase YjhB (NUDIX family)
MDVATVVALRRGRVLLVAQPGSNALALPGGKLEAGE